MLFSDPIFLFVFLPLALCMFYVAPKKLKNIVLLLFSLAFYTWGERKMVVLLVVSSLIDFFAAILISKSYRKLGLYISILFNLGILIYFKYSNFILENIHSIAGVFNKDSQLTTLNVMMPLGISFFTFQTMSYTIDVYRGKVKATYNFVNFCTYVSLFPQLIAGPIVRYQEIENQLTEKSFSLYKFSEGTERFIKGLFKKIVIANNLVLVADVAFESPEGYGTLISWLGIVTYTLYIYYDFSGYSDMAIGLGKMFGFDFPENFDHPYTSSKSVREFWRKWHMSMSNWFRDYVYISLGGNRKSKNRVLINLLIVFIVTGLWHGAAWGFVAWGLWHGLFLILERKGWLKFKGIASNVYVLMVVMLGFIFFRANTITQACKFIKQLFWYQPIYDIDILRYAIRKETLYVYILALLFSFPVYKFLQNKLQMQFKNSSIALLKTPVYFIMMVVCYTYISIGAYNPFIYFRF